MTAPSVRQLCLLCVFCCFGCWSGTDASPFDQWDDGIELRKVMTHLFLLFSLTLCRVIFLFHYSKARNSVGAVQQESHSVHPLMRLSPKLSQRRKKKVLLLV
uniref:Secreted protein n=1 Tax=Sphaeramia orbicularis TaxID=375764 RepID=A0A673B3Z4_9TELE